MDDAHLDALARSLAEGRSRRALAWFLAGAVSGGLLTFLAPPEIESKQRRSRKQRKRKRRRAARHEAGSTLDPNVPPMRQRFRLKSSFDSSGFSDANQVILTALQRYGMILADNGGDWFLSGVPDERWDNDDLHQLKNYVHGRDFEAVDCASLMTHPDSGQVAAE